MHDDSFVSSWVAPCFYVFTMPLPLGIPFLWASVALVMSLARDIARVPGANQMTEGCILLYMQDSHNESPSVLLMLSAEGSRIQVCGGPDISWFAGLQICPGMLYVL